LLPVPCRLNPQLAKHAIHIGTSVTLIENCDTTKQRRFCPLPKKSSTIHSYCSWPTTFRTKNRKALLRQPLTHDEVILAVDSKLDDVFDLDDATKVKREGNHV